MNLIKEYELQYISQDEFFYYLWGAGQQLFNEESESRLKFYVARAAEDHHYDYYISPIPELGSLH